MGIVAIYDIADYFLLDPFVLRNAFFHSVVYRITYGFFQGSTYFVCGAEFRFWAYLITSKFSYFKSFFLYRDFLLGYLPTLSIPTSSIPIWSTSHFVNSHLVNSQLVNVDKAGVDKMGIDEVGS